MSAKNLVSPKVVAAASGAGAGAVVSSLIFWVIGTAAYGVPAVSGSVSEAVAAVPSPVVGVVGLLLVVLGAAIPGYQAVDPQRPNLDEPTYPDVDPADVEWYALPQGGVDDEEGDAPTVTEDSEVL